MYMICLGEHNRKTFLSLLCFAMEQSVNLVIVL